MAEHIISLCHMRSRNDKSISSTLLGECCEMTHVHSEITLLNRESLISGIAGSVFVSIDKGRKMFSC